MSITLGYFKNRKRLLLEVLLIGSLVLIPHTAPALDLNVDGGSSYTLDSHASINYESEYIGYFSSGSFSQNGGSNTASSLYLGFTPSGTGTYNLSRGTLSAAQQYVGYSGTGAFNQTGGSNTATHMYLAGDTGGSGTYNLMGGALSASSIENCGHFNQTGGNLAIQNGLDNTGLFSYSGGSFTGRLVNYGTVYFNEYFLATNGLANYSTIPLVIGPGQYITLIGQGLDNQGIIVVNGTLSGENLLNGRTGSLHGTGTIRGCLTNDGVLRPSGGTLNVFGPFTQSASGTMETGITSLASYDRLNIQGSFVLTQVDSSHMWYSYYQGTAALNGSLKPILLGGYAPDAGQVFNILTATDGVSGTFSSIINQYITPTLSWQLRYGANTVDLFVQRDYANSLLGLDPNRSSVGRALNSLAAEAVGAPDSAAANTRGDLNTVLTAIDRLPTAGAVSNALNQLSPEKASSLATLSFAGADLQKRILARRITDLRFEARGTGDLQSDFGLARPMQAFSSSNLSELLSGTGEAPSGSSWGLYFDPAVIIANQGSAGDQTGYDFSVAGFSTGIDYRVRKDLLVGLATGYNHTEANFHDNGGAVRGDALPVTVYAAYTPDIFYVYGSMGYSLNFFDLRRNIAFGGLDRTAKSSPEGDMLNAYAEAGYEFKAGRFFITPMASFSYSNLWVGDFTESEAGAIDLKVLSQNAESLQSGLGARISAPTMWGSIPLVPQIYATWQHEFSNDSRGLDARLSQGSPVFTFQTNSPERDFAVVGTNLTLAARNDLKVRLDYNVEAGQNHYTAHYLSLGCRWDF